MDTIDAKLTQYQPQILSIVRIVFGLLILQHALSKLFGFPAAQPANFQLVSMFGAAALIEIIGGTLVTIGLFTRYAALIISGEMAVAHLIFSNRFGLFPWTSAGRASGIPLVNGGNTEVTYCFAFLFLAFFGGGIWSLDAKLRNRT